MGPGPAGAFLGQEIRPPTGLRGAFGGLMIRAGASENAVFGAVQAGMTLSDRHMRMIWRSEPAPAKTRGGRRPLLPRVVPTRPLGRNRIRLTAFDYLAANVQFPAVFAHGAILLSGAASW